MTLTVELPDDEAEALAQLCKRFGFHNAVALSTPHDGGRERDAMLQALGKLRRALAESGFAPR